MCKNGGGAGSWKYAGIIDIIEIGRSRGSRNDL